MTTEEAKQYVTDGLARLRAQRIAEEKEAQLETYEAEMISFCNQHSATARKNRQEQEKCENDRARRTEKREAMRRREEAAQKAWEKYGYACVGILLLTAWTPLPGYGAAALMAGLAVFPAVYVVKLYELV